MPTVVGLDLSLSAFGVAVWRNRRVYTVTLQSELWADPNGWDRAARRYRLRLLLDDHLRGPRGDIVAIIEDRIPPMRKGGKSGGWQSALDRAELSGTVEDLLFYRAVPIVKVPVPTLKKYATGRGDADKRAMLDRARDLVGTQIPIDDDNQADAFWLMCMGVQHYALARPDHPMWTVVHGRSMDRVQWPEWLPKEGGTK